MKKMNKKGFTLIELLAVIVVLAIILVITVPMILNTLGDTKGDALQSSANATARFYEEQIGLKLIGKGDTTFANDAINSGSLQAVSERCISYSESKLIGLNIDDYAIAIKSADVTANPADGITANTLSVGTCSSVKLTAKGQATVKLIGTANGNFGNISKTSNN